jgi:hypothetical protein
LTVLFVCAAMLTACDNPSARGTARFFVRDFGAVPDEAQADGDAIRKCIAATGKLAKVVFEAGIYRMEPAPAGACGKRPHERLPTVVY